MAAWKDTQPWERGAMGSLTAIPLLNISNVTDMNYMFGNTNLTTVPLLNTSNVIDMGYMFYRCSSLTAIPLFNTSKATNVKSMFEYCTRVESGALALYQQLSSQANPPSSHSKTFYSCGSYTASGTAELEQIPSDWK